MSTKPPKPPNSVPEEDLNLHEDFSPIIAENGLIRQPKAPEVSPESLPAFLTQLDTLQDLVQLRHAEEADPQPTPQTLSPAVEKEQPVQAGKNETAQKSALNETKTAAATTTFLTVREAQTTTLVPVTKLTLARRITLLKRKRQHARRLKARQKLRLKAAAQQERIRQAVGLQGTGAVPPQQTVASLTQARRRWPWVWVLLFLFLGSVSGLVPVEKIPLLRELAYAMGFDKNDTSRMSFLRALLTWTDKTVGLPGNWTEDANGTSLWARGENMADSANIAAQSQDDAFGWNAGLARQRGQTSLIDIQALNALQRQKGHALDGVRSAVQVPPGAEEAEVGPAVLRDDKVNVRTEANRDKGEVFFGSDNNAVNRNFKDGYDSSKTLASVKNPHIANGVPIDWLTNMTKRTMKTDTALGGVNKELNSTQVAWSNRVADIGEKKEHRDLYHAWITSRMSKYTPNIMLKKGLADSSFLGADIPVMASNVLSFSGVQVDIEAMQEDESAWQEYLEWERECQAELSSKGASGRIDNAINDYNSLFVEFNTDAEPNVGFPTDCSPGGIDNNGKYSSFVGKIDKIIRLCGTVSEGYTVLGRKCDMQSFKGTCNKQIRIDYAQKWSNFKGYCQSKYLIEEQNWKDTWCTQHAAECQAGVEPPPYPQEEWARDATKYTQVAWNNGKTIEDDVKEQTGGNSGYFSAVVRAKVDENGHVIYVEPGSDKNVQETVYQGMMENEVLGK